MDRKGDVTALLQELKAGDRSVERRLLELVYPQLKKIAKRHLRGERAAHTLQPTALVNEAYLQLTGQMGKDWQDRSHFFAVAAKLMRHILVDYARNRRAEKREGALKRVELTDGLSVADDRLDEVLFVDNALAKLAEFDPRRAAVVELKFFGGMTESEVAEVLHVALRTVKRDWNVARAWLHAELSQTAGEA